MALLNLGETVSPLGFSAEGMGAGGQMAFDPYAAAAYWRNNPEAAASANALLKPYGVNVPTSLPTNFLFPGANTGQGWAGQHPGTANALQGAILGAAMTPSPQGPEGWGAGFSRALQGPLNAQQYLRSRAMQAYQAPFAQADVLSGLVGRQAEEQFYRKYADAMDTRASAALDKLNAIAPRDIGGQIYVPSMANPNSPSWTDIGPDELNREHGSVVTTDQGAFYVMPSNTAGAPPMLSPIPGLAPTKTAEQNFDAMFNKAYPEDPNTKPGSPEAKKRFQQYQDSYAQWRGATAGAQQGAKDTANNTTGPASNTVYTQLTGQIRDLQKILGNPNNIMDDTTKAQIQGQIDSLTALRDGNGAPAPAPPAKPTGAKAPPKINPLSGQVMIPGAQGRMLYFDPSTAQISPLPISH